MTKETKKVEEAKRAETTKVEATNVANVSTPAAKESTKVEEAAKIEEAYTPVKEIIYDNSLLVNAKKGKEVANSAKEERLSLNASIRALYNVSCGKKDESIYIDSETEKNASNWCKVLGISEKSIKRDNIANVRKLITENCTSLFANNYGKIYPVRLQCVYTDSIDSNIKYYKYVEIDWLEVIRIYFTKVYNKGKKAIEDHKPKEVHFSSTITVICKRMNKETKEVEEVEEEVITDYVDMYGKPAYYVNDNIDLKIFDAIEATKEEKKKDTNNRKELYNASTGLSLEEAKEALQKAIDNKKLEEAGTLEK